MQLICLCLEFFKTGLFSIGGGLATLPFLYEMSDKYGWFTYEQLADMIAVSESTPGPMGVNMATFAGYTTYGIIGAILATFFLTLPSIIIILVISGFLQKFRSSVYVKNALTCIRPASLALITNAATGLFILAFSLNYSCSLYQFMNWKAVAIGCILAVLYYFKNKWHPIFFILFGAVAGVVFSL